MTFPRRAGLVPALALLTLAAALAPTRAAAQSAPAKAQSPNGQIVFQSDRGGDFSDIYVVDADGKHETRLTTDPADESNPVWSPDGSQIAFVTNRRGAYEVFLMNADGSNQRPLRETPVETVEVAWSPDGKMLSYATRGGLREGDVFPVRAGAPGGGDSTAPPVNLTATFAGLATDPSWSPDSTHVVFRGDIDFGNADLYTVDINGIGLTQITYSPAEAEAAPRWSGGLIAYERVANFVRSIYVVNADGTGTPTSVSGAVESSGGPVWSPDGARLAFSALSGGVYAVNPNGTG